jgi:predicted secreted hydrolase
MRARLIIPCFLLFGAAALAVEVVPGFQLEFPRDAGSHPQFRLEWWYVTGIVVDDHGEQQGFQVTFFRTRNESADVNPSSFAPRQLLFAHAAISDPARGSLLHAERSARAGLGLAEARTGNTDVVIDDWSLRATDEQLQTHVKADAFSLDLSLSPTQPPLLQGDRGFSQKDPQAHAASYYYSLPQLRVAGTMTVAGRAQQVNGTAWLDHEWASSYLDARSAGWDWLGINMLDGSALMVMRVRDETGASYWANAAWRSSQRIENFQQDQVHWTPLRSWRSPRTGVEYPIAWRVKVGGRELVIRPSMDDQENDARGSTGTLYWEGAVEVNDAAGKALGRGYLELTGYGERVRL